MKEKRKVYEILNELRERAKKDGNAIRYFIFCLDMNDPKKEIDMKLYSEGYKQLFGVDPSEEKLERILRK